MRRILLGAGFALLAAVDPAWAGAWLAPKGGQEITTVAFGDRDGATVSEQSVYWEVPEAEDTSVVIAPWFEQAQDLSDGWRGEAVIGVKRALFRDETDILAIQGGAFWRSDPPRSCGEGGAELRALGGRSLGDGAFINLEVAGRLLEGGCHGAKVELSAGFRPYGDWLAMGQLFFDAPDDGEQNLKVQVSLVRFDNAGAGLQLGVRLRLDDDNTEPALVLGFWRAGAE